MRVADQVSQLEETKFLRLMRYMVDDPSANHRRDRLEVKAVPADLRDAQVVVKPMGKIGSVDTFFASWVFQMAHLPICLWKKGIFGRFLEDCLKRGFASLAMHPGPNRLLAGIDAAPEYASELLETGVVTYHLFANVMHDPDDDGARGFQKHAADMFERMLPGVPVPRFGLATPASMAVGSPKLVESFIRDLLQHRSGYQVVARSGSVSVAPFTEHGMFLSGGSKRADRRSDLATAASSLTPRGNLESTCLPEFEALLNDARTAEADIQAFLDRHPHLLRGIDSRYAEARGHVALVDGDGSRLIPDFMARLEGREVWDVIELKRPQHPIVVGGCAQSRVSAQTARALAKLLEYRDFFAVPDNRRRLESTFGTAPFEPCLVVVIGRGWPNTRFRWTNGRPGVPDATVVSYDYLLEQARRCAEDLADDRPSRSSCHPSDGSPEARRDSPRRPVDGRG